MKAAFLFPGQGSQFVGMGEDYCRGFPSVRRLFEGASERMGMNLRTIMAKGPPRLLAETRIAQPVIFTMNVAIATLLIERGIAPFRVAGHSLGQFAAVAVAGALDFASTLDLVIERGRLMQTSPETGNGGMMAVDGLTRETVERSIAQLGVQVWIANFNAPSQCAVSGSRPGLRRLQKTLGALGGNCRWLAVAVPAHTPLMQTAAAPLARRIDELEFRAPSVPVLGSASALPLTDAAAIRAELREHMLASVNWADCLRRLYEDGCTVMIETGPGRVLKGLALRNDTRARCRLTSTVKDFEQTCRDCLTLEETTACA